MVADNVEKTHIDISKFEDMIRANLVTKETLLDFVLEFSPPKDKQNVMSIFKLV